MSESVVTNPSRQSTIIGTFSERCTAALRLPVSLTLLSCAGDDKKRQRKAGRLKRPDQTFWQFLLDEVRFTRSPFCIEVCACTSRSKTEHSSGW